MGLLGISTMTSMFCTNTDPAGPCFSQEGPLKLNPPDQRQFDDFKPLEIKTTDGYQFQQTCMDFDDENGLLLIAGTSDNAGVSGSSQPYWQQFIGVKSIADSSVNSWRWIAVRIIQA